MKQRLAFTTQRQTLYYKSSWLAPPAALFLLYLSTKSTHWLESELAHDLARLLLPAGLLGLRHDVDAGDRV